MEVQNLCLIRFGQITCDYDHLLRLQATLRQQSRTSQLQRANCPPPAPLELVTPLQPVSRCQLRILNEQGCQLVEQEFSWTEEQLGETFEVRAAGWWGVVEILVTVQRLEEGLGCQHEYWRAMCGYLSFLLSQEQVKQPTALRPCCCAKSEAGYLRLQQELLCTLEELHSLKEQQMALPPPSDTSCSTAPACAACQQLQSIYETKLAQTRREHLLARQALAEDVRILEERVAREREKARKAAREMQAAFEQEMQAVAERMAAEVKVLKGTAGKLEADRDSFVSQLAACQQHCSIQSAQLSAGQAALNHSIIELQTSLQNQQQHRKQQARELLDLTAQLSCSREQVAKLQVAKLQVASRELGVELQDRSEECDRLDKSLAQKDAEVQLLRLEVERLADHCRQLEQLHSQVAAHAYVSQGQMEQKKTTTLMHIIDLKQKEEKRESSWLKDPVFEEDSVYIVGEKKQLEISGDSGFETVRDEVLEHGPRRVIVRLGRAALRRYKAHRRRRYHPRSRPRSNLLAPQPPAISAISPVEDPSPKAAQMVSLAYAEEMINTIENKYKGLVHCLETDRQDLQDRLEEQARLARQQQLQLERAGRQLARSQCERDEFETNLKQESASNEAEQAVLEQVYKEIIEHQKDSAEKHRRLLQQELAAAQDHSRALAQAIEGLQPQLRDTTDQLKTVCLQAEDTAMQLDKAMNEIVAWKEAVGILETKADALDNDKQQLAIKVTRIEAENQSIRVALREAARAAKEQAQAQQREQLQIESGPDWSEIMIRLENEKFKLLEEHQQEVEHHSAELEAALRDKEEAIAALQQSFAGKRRRLEQRLEQRLEHEQQVLEQEGAKEHQKKVSKQLNDEERYKLLSDRLEGMRREMEAERQHYEVRLAQKEQEIEENEKHIRDFKNRSLSRIDEFRREKMDHSARLSSIHYSPATPPSSILPSDHSPVPTLPFRSSHTIREQDPSNELLDIERANADLETELRIEIERLEGILAETQEELANCRQQMDQHRFSCEEAETRLAVALEAQDAMLQIEGLQQQDRAKLQTVISEHLLAIHNLESQLAESATQREGMQRTVHRLEAERLEAQLALAEERKRFQDLLEKTNLVVGRMEGELAAKRQVILSAGVVVGCSVEPVHTSRFEAGVMVDLPPFEIESAPQPSPCSSFTALLPPSSQSTPAAPSMTNDQLLDQQIGYEIRLSELQQLLELSERERLHCEEDRRQLLASLKMAGAQLMALKGVGQQLGNAKSQLAQEQQTNTGLMNSLKDLKQLNAELLASTNQKDEHIHHLYYELEQAKHALHEAQAKASTLRHTNAALTGTVARHQETIDNLSASLETELCRKDRQLAQVSLKVHDKQSENEQLRATTQVLRRRAAEADLKIREIQRFGQEVQTRYRAGGDMEGLVRVLLRELEKYFVMIVDLKDRLAG